MTKDWKTYLAEIDARADYNQKHPPSYTIECKICTDIPRLTQRIRALEEALGFYANQENWKQSDRFFYYYSQIDDSDMDKPGKILAGLSCSVGGKRAREILAEEVYE